MNTIISYQLSGDATQLLTGLVVTTKEIKSLKKEIQLENEGTKTDSYTGVKYAIFHSPVTRLSDGTWDLGQRYFVKANGKAVRV